MRNLMILVFAAFSFNVAMNAQVKDQFRDRGNSSTIVVVKEDNANDQKVLNEYFDLADMSMNDQIMIMTVPEEPKPTSAPDVENATASKDGSVEDFFEEFEAEEVEVEVQTEETSSIAEVPVLEEVVIEKEEVTSVPNTVKKPSAVRSSSRVASTRARGNYTVKNSADVKRAAQKKYFGKKKKRKKRKKSKRKFFGKKKSNNCYSF